MQRLGEAGSGGGEWCFKSFCILALHPGLPSREESAEVFGVHGLLNEQVDLSAHAQHRSILHPLQLFLQAQQHPLRHLVEALTVAVGKFCT